MGLFEFNCSQWVVQLKLLALVMKRDMVYHYILTVDDVCLPGAGNSTFQFPKVDLFLILLKKNLTRRLINMSMSLCIRIGVQGDYRPRVVKVSS